MRKVKSGGGLAAIAYTFRKAREVGGLLPLWRAMRSKNACKTCALGMGGQAGGMVNELGHFPEVCKKSMQAMAADMQGAVRPEFWETYSLPQLRAFTPQQLETSGRLTTPMLLRRGEQHYRPISWDDAISRIATKLKATDPDESFWYFSGRSSNEAGFLLQLFARVFGTNNVNNCSYYCHQASGVGLTGSVGVGTATIVLDDLDKADLVMLIGGNPASNHPRLMSNLMRLRRRGGKVIVINPVKETGLVRFRVPSDVRSLLFGTEIASLYVQPHIGGDLALLNGISKRVAELEAVDNNFVQQHCEGWPELAEHLQQLSWDEIVRLSGVSRAEIDEIAEQYAKSNAAVFAWTMGITHHAVGVKNVQAIANLALMRGMVGRPGAGLLPIRGHSNVQGMGSLGVTPQLKQAVFDRLEYDFGLQLPNTTGLDTMGCMEAAAEQRMKVGFCLGGNLYGSNPDANYAAEALQKLDMLVYMSTTLNTGHAHGTAEETIILPVLARDEEPQPTTQESMFSYVRLSEGGAPRHEGPRSEVEVIAALAEEVLSNQGPIDWSTMRRHSRIREAIGKIVPGFDGMNDIDSTKKEFQIGGRTLHDPSFPTPSGRAQLHAHPLPELAGEGDSLRLMTVRSEGQFNTVVYEEYDLYRGQECRDVILVHPDDVQRLGLTPESRITVRSATGKLENILLRTFDDIKPGNALMYYPEANVLVSRDVDPQSKTPAFKSIVVTLEAHQPVALSQATVAAS